MKSLKSHILLLFALLSMLGSIESFVVFNKIVNTYEEKILKNYTILIVAKTKLKNINIDNISKIEKIDIQNTLQNLQKTLKNVDMKKLQSKLPIFYKLYFSHLPAPTELNMIEKKLLSNPNIVRIESFKARQNQTYNLLKILKVFILVFMGIVTFISFLLILKQLEVWRLQHKEKMYIMELFGAPLSMRSSILLKISIIDSILSVIFMSFFLWFVLQSEVYLNLLNQLGISIEVNIFRDLGLFLLISLIVSFVATFLVVFSKKDEMI